MKNGDFGNSSKDDSWSYENAPIEERMIFRRAVETAVWAMPLVGTRGFIEATRRDLKGDWNDVIYFSKPMESRHGFLTANNQTPYVVSSINTREGPMVLELPAATEEVKFFGSLVDIWDYPFTDVGPEGADGGKGGKYLLLPPGYDGEIPDGYLLFRPVSYAVYMALRPVFQRGVPLERVIDYVKRVKLYPLDDPERETRYIDAYPYEWDTLPKYDLRYYRMISDVLNEEPVLERDFVATGMLSAIGIEKGKPFEPDGRTARILEAAIKEAYDYMQWLFENRALVNYFAGTHWMTFNIPREQALAGWPFVDNTKLLIDERAVLYHYATFMPRKLGGGSFYILAIHDSEERPLEGDATYRLRMPPNVPARDFWSILVYSFATHGFIKGSPRVGLSSLDDLDVNEDGSVDIYFAPEPPEGKERNWIPTGERFWVVLRLYGPGKEIFEKSWTLEDIERLS